MGILYVDKMDASRLSAQATGDVRVYVDGATKRDLDLVQDSAFAIYSRSSNQRDEHSRESMMFFLCIRTFLRSLITVGSSPR